MFATTTKPPPQETHSRIPLPSPTPLRRSASLRTRTEPRPNIRDANHTKSPGIFFDANHQDDDRRDAEGHLRRSASLRTRTELQLNRLSRDANRNASRGDGDALRLDAASSLRRGNSFMERGERRPSGHGVRSEQTAKRRPDILKTDCRNGGPPGRAALTPGSPPRNRSLVSTMGALLGRECVWVEG